MTWLYLALLAPLLYAFIVLIDDNLLKNVYKSPQVGAAISGVFGLVPAVGFALFNRGSLSLAANMIVLSLVAGFLTVIAIYCYFQGFEKANPSVVAAVLTLSPLVVPFIAHFAVNERLSAAAIIGFIVLIVAAFTYSIVDTKKLSVTKTLAPVLAAALILDGVSVINKYVYQRADFYAAFIYFSLGMFIGGLFFVGVSRKTGSAALFKQIYKQGSLKLLVVLILAECLNLAAEFAHDRAISLGSVSLVNVLENIQPLYVLLIAVLLFPFLPQYFREAEAGHIKLKLALAVVMVGGVFLVTR